MPQKKQTTTPVETGKVGNLPAIKNDSLPEPVQGTDAERLIAIAIEKNVPVETMEKLLAMRRELKQEAAKEEYFRALAAFQSECPTIQKNETVSYVSKKTGGTTKYKYAPLDVIVTTVRETLRKHGFSYTITTEQDAEHVTAKCNAHHVAGHTEVTTFTIPIDFDSYMNPAQKVASALTYAKRYAFCNAFGIMTGDEDDDSQGSGERYTGRQQKQQSISPREKPEESFVSRDDLKAQIELVIEQEGFPADIRAEVKKYIAREDANIQGALQRVNKIMREAQEKRETPQITGEVEQKLGDGDTQLFGDDPYGPREGNLTE